MINIDKIEWKNFMGYGDYVSTIDFKYDGVVFICGINGGGKSSAIVQTISWCVFGKTTFDDQPGDSVVNWSTGKNCIVRICTKDGYEIIRTRNYENKDELSFTKDGENVTRGTNTSVQEQINNTFKIDYQTFVSSVVFGQLSNGFLGFTELKRRKVLERFMKMGSFSALAETAKVKIEGVNRDIAVVDSKISNIELEIKAFDQKIAGFRDSGDQFNTSKQKKIQDIKNALITKKNEITVSIAEINKKIELSNEKLKDIFLFDLDDLKIKWNEYEKSLVAIDSMATTINNINLDKTRAESDLKNVINSLNDINSDMASEIDIENLELKWADVKKIDDTIAKKEEDARQLGFDIKTNMSELAKEKERVDKIEALGPECSECFQSIDNKYKDKALKDCDEKINSLAEKNNKYKNDAESLKISITKIKALKVERLPSMAVSEAKKINLKISEDKKKIDQLKLRQNQLIKDIEIINADINEKKEKLKKLNKIPKPSMSIDEYNSKLNVRNLLKKSIESDQKSIEKIKDDFKLQIESESGRIKAIQVEKNPYDEMVADLHKHIDELNVKLIDQNKSRDEYIVLRDHLGYIKDSYGNKKKIKAFWISQLIPYLNGRIKYYLDIFKVGRIMQFDEFLNMKSNKWSYKYHSGGEQMRINLSIMFGLNDLHNSTFGQQSNIMVLDEVDAALDVAGIESLVAILTDDIMNRDDGPDSIFVISHRLEMKDRFPYKITVENKDELSHIIHE